MEYKIKQSKVNKMADFVHYVLSQLKLKLGTSFLWNQFLIFKSLFKVVQ